MQENDIPKETPTEESPAIQSMISDDEGLQRAYNQESGLYRHNDTLFVAGTKTFGEPFTEWYKIPFSWNVTNINRYKTADKYMNRPDGQGINRLVGHSMGSAVVKELGKRRGISNVIEYSSPSIDLIPRGLFGHYPSRFSYKNDPVSILDFGAKRYNEPRLNPHSYGGLHDRRKSNFLLNLPYF